jgi:hypothetical protein
MSGEKSPQEVRRANAKDFADSVRTEHGVELGFDRAGAEWLDSFIQSRGVALTPATVTGLTQLVGSYLGECIIGHYGGEWTIVDGRGCVRLGENGTADPFWIIAYCLTHRSVYSVSDLFSAVPAMAKVRTGGLYAAHNNDGAYRIYKVLAVDNLAVHLRKYSNQFDAPPSRLDPSSLNLGLNFEAWQAKGAPASELPMGHFPLAHDGFWKMQPSLIQVEPIADDELAGYHTWLQNYSSSVETASPPPTDQRTTEKKWWQFWK